MNKKQAMEKLLSLLSEYGSDFVFDDEFVEELLDIISRHARGSEGAFLKMFIKQLCYVAEFGRDVHLADGNELLSHTGTRSWYSLHMKNKTLNMRILMTFTKEEQPLFLCCFLEQDHKSVTSYSSYLNIADKRLEGYEHEI